MWQIDFRHDSGNRPAGSAAIMGASLTASLFLSLLCSLGYNLWAYEAAGGQTPELTPLAALFLFLLLMLCLSLALIIRSTFELFMGTRVHQFGILSSIGATPKQIRARLRREAAVLCTVPICLGCLLGTGLCYGAIQAVNHFAAGVAGRRDAVFQYHWGVLAVNLLASGLTVLLSQSAPARKLSKLSPIEAIRNGRGLQPKRRKRSPLLSLLFGVEGELAGNALHAQKKALRIANLSLVLSFLGFAIMLCFTTLSSISTRHTYFERYRDCWDVMVTVKDTNISDFDLTGQLQSLPGVREAAVYQKAEGTCLLPQEVQSQELLSLGGYEALTGRSSENGQLPVKAPILILDDASFLRYCRQIGAPEGLDGAILLNRIWDSTHSNFRYKEYVPFVDPAISATRFSGLPEKIPVLACTQEVPSLREEYPNDSLVHFLPLSLWEALEARPETVEADTCLRIFASGDGSLGDLTALQDRVSQLLSPSYEILPENRVQEQQSNDQMIAGMQWIFGAFCGLLAMIGIANVFSNTLGFLRSRKREFAQYMSIGLTPRQMQKVFAVEALVIGGKPLLWTLPLTLVFVELAVRASYLDPREFWAEAPYLPVCLFGAAILFFVGLAYHIGGRSILRSDLTETLRNDALM